MTKGMKSYLFALLAILAAPLAAGESIARADQGGREFGLRTAAGDDVKTVALYQRWSSTFLQQNVVGRYLPADGTASWEVELSYWEGDGDDATVITIGPTFEYGLRGDRLRLGFGLQPTLFSDYESENRNLGGPFEFTSHIGLRWPPNPAWVLGARIQHTSNAGIYERNPGVDLLAVEIGTRF